MAKKYILDEFNNKIEVTDEVGNTTVNEIKCCESGTPFKMAFVSQAVYNELEAAGLLKPNTIYEITDDTTLEDLDKLITETKEDHNKRLENIECYYLGSTSDSPTSTTSTFYNSITKEGFYNFTYNGKPYLMFVSKTELLLRQAIVDFLTFNAKGALNIEVICRQKNISNNAISVNTIKYASVDYIDNKYNEVVNLVNGKHLYEHRLTLEYNASSIEAKIYLSVIKTSSNAMTIYDFNTHITTSNYALVSVTGYYRNSTSNVNDGSIHGIRFDNTSYHVRYGGIDPTNNEYVTIQLGDLILTKDDIRTIY